jgi:hypothetical protein
MTARCILALPLLALGCRPADEPAWAVQHATIDLQGDGFEGYLVWELYSKRWKKAHDAKYHLCARVQRITGSPVEALPGCPACADTWSVRSEELESDCAGEPATSGAFAGPTHIALGPVPADLADLSPFPGEADGWYLGFDGEAVTAQGFAWPETLELTAAEAATRSLDRRVLWPAYAWQLTD